MSNKELFFIWVKKFEALPQHPMSKELSEAFVHASIAGDNFGPVPELEAQFMWKLIDARAKYIGLELSYQLKAFLTLLLDNPGIAVMYLYYLKCRAGTRMLDMAEFTNIFPMGYPSKEDLAVVWDAQKVKGGNLLDKLAQEDLLCF